jgi:nucleotide-binding universal stress UspA family protein
MSFEVLLSVLTGDDVDQSVLDAAHSMARHFRSRIDVLHVSEDPHALPYLDAGVAPGVVASMLAAVDAQIAARKARAKDVFSRWHKAADLPAESRWIERTGTEREVSRQGRFADLVIVGRPAASAENLTTAWLSGVLEAALFGTARPVLVVPPGLEMTVSVANGPIAIAWDGSLEADRAVAAAMPILQGASRATVVMGEETRQKTDLNPHALIDYLARHGVEATVVSSKVDSGDTGQYLLAEAKKVGASLLVMGAYTHSRLRELVLGGATKHVCASADLPVLMAH